MITFQYSTTMYVKILLHISCNFIATLRRQYHRLFILAYKIMLLCHIIIFMYESEFLSNPIACHSNIARNTNETPPKALAEESTLCMLERRVSLNHCFLFKNKWRTEFIYTIDRVLFSNRRSQWVSNLIKQCMQRQLLHQVIFAI